MRGAGCPGEAAVAGANLALQAKRKKQIVERIDQVAEALLRLGDHPEELLELLVVGRSSGALIETANHAFEFGDLLRFAPHVDAEKSDQNEQSNGRGFEMKLGALDAVPRKPGEDGGDDEQKEKGEAPKLVLTLFVGFETRHHRAAQVLRDGPVLGAGFWLWSVVHAFRKDSDAGAKVCDFSS